MAPPTTNLTFRSDYGSHRDEFLYDPALLSDLSFEGSGVRFSPPVTVQHPGPDLKIRPLRESDYGKGYMKLLSQLTSVGDITKEQYLKRFHEMKSSKNTYFVTVIEDLRIGEIIAASTLLVEKKFIHNCGIRGQLEDVIVNTSCRGLQLGKLIVTTINMLSKKVGCYKISLNCQDHLIPFYNTIGYKCEKGNANSMTIRFPPPPQSKM